MSDRSEFQLGTTRHHLEPVCEIWLKSIQYFLRSSDNKILKMGAVAAILDVRSVRISVRHN